MIIKINNNGKITKEERNNDNINNNISTNDINTDNNNNYNKEIMA